MIPRLSSLGRIGSRVLGALVLLGATRGWSEPAPPAPGFPLVRSYFGADLGFDPLSFAATQQDNDVLFLGSRGAVLRYDGETWTRLPVEGALTVRGLDFGPDGRLWVAGFGDFGWFESSDSGAWRFHSLRPFLPADTRPPGEMWHVFADNAGGATFVADDRILRWDGTKLEAWSMPGARRVPAVRLGSQVYVHHLPTGLHALHRDGPDLIIPASLLADAAVLWIDARPDHWLLGTSTGLYRYDHGRLVPFAPDVSAFVVQHRLTGVVALRDGRFALGTYEGGVALMTPDGRFDGILAEREGLPSPVIRAMYVDREGQLWIMSTSSISRVDLASATRVFDVRAGLPAQPYHAVTSSGGRITLAGERGVYELGADGRGFTRISAAGESVHDIRGTPEGLVVSTPKDVLRVHEGKAESLHRSKFDVFAAVPRRPPGQGMFLFDHRQLLLWTDEAPARLLVDELPDYGRHVVEDDDGSLWIELPSAGVRFARPDASGPVVATAVPPEFGLPDETGRALVRGHRDGALVVAGERGAWFKPAGMATFLPVRDWPRRPVSALTDLLPDDTLWSVHPATDRLAAAVGRIAINGRTARWEPREVVGLAGIGPPRSIHCEPGAPAVLWIGGTRSVLRHPVSALTGFPPPPPLLRAEVRSTPDAAATPIRGPLPYTTRRIAFSFAVPRFMNRDDLRLESRIDGIDADWVPAGTAASRELTGVREGRYRFAVRAVAGTGAAGAPAEFDFEVLPPWWRTPPVVIGAVLALGPLGYGFYRLRVRALQRRTLVLEAKVRQRTEELEAANAAKTDFVANMSHDIRNPLNGIVGLTLALEDTRLDPRQREIVATLRECSTYLSSLVDDVLDFATIEAGRLELRSGPFAPGELLRSIVETLRADASRSGAVITVETSGDLPAQLLGDAGRIQQILVNFASNALKYAGGSIRLSAGVPSDAPEEVEFAVQDRGPGISPADQPTLFAKFTRLRQQHGGEPIPGTGLGLAACRLLADAMGGSVGVTSSPGDGARFHLRLPRVTAREPAPAPVEVGAASVLLVEDTDYNAWAATAVLARLGLTCERATSGEEALRLFAAKRFNLVLLDRNLPDMDGTEVARRIRELEAGPAQAVLLAVTAYCTAQDRELCLQAGMDAFVGKPLTPDKLRRVLAETGRRQLGTPPVHVPPEAARAVPDLSLLSYLGSGSGAGVGEQLRRYVRELDQTLEEITRASAARDQASLAALAHHLLGQARMVGAGELGDAASRLEVAARSRDEPGSAAWLARARAAAATLREAVLPGGPATPSA